jgi:hypothetical protein
MADQNQIRTTHGDSRMAAPLSPTADTMPAAASPWASSLQDDLIRLLASRLLAGDLLDYVRFRAVCAPWRSGTASPRGQGVVDPRFHPRRWAMLPEGDGLYPGHPDLRGQVRFFNLDTGAFVRVRIPLFEDHCVLDCYEGLLDRPAAGPRHRHPPAPPVHRRRSRPTTTLDSPPADARGTPSLIGTGESSLSQIPLHYCYLLCWCRHRHACAQ